MENAPGAQSHAEALPRTHRLRRRREFLAVQREGQRVHTPHFVLVVRAAPEQRIGVTVTKRVANAVGRNRVKRLAREVFRRNRSLFPPASDVVFVARSGAPTLDYEGLRAEVAEANKALLRAAARGPRPPSAGTGRKRRRGAAR